MTNIYTSRDTVLPASQKLIDTHVRFHNQGISILNLEDSGSESLYRAFSQTKRMMGWFDVAIHGGDDSSEGFFCIHSPGENGQSHIRHYLTPLQLAQAIFGSGWRKPSPIRLYACHGAIADHTGVPIALQLARILKTEVLATNKSNGGNNRTGFAIFGKGEYTIFHPQDTPKLVLKSGYSVGDIAKGTREKKFHW